MATTLEEARARFQSSDNPPLRIICYKQRQSEAKRIDWDDLLSKKDTRLTFIDLERLYPNRIISDLSTHIGAFDEKTIPSLNQAELDSLIEKLARAK